MSGITQQPASWTSTSSADASASEHLKGVSSLSINHGFSIRQVLPGIPIRAKYGIFNDQGEHLFSAFEESDLFQLICCTNNRQFTMHIVDNNSRELIRVHRELQRCSRCCSCGSCESCMHEVTVELPPGHIIGTVKQEGSTGGRNYIIKDATNKPMLTIMGPCCICDGTCSCGCENRFILLGTDRSTEIGAIDKKYLGSMQVSSANPVAFTLNFPIDLDVRMKALVLGALFLIDIANYQIIRLRN